MYKRKVSEGLSRWQIIGLPMQEPQELWVLTLGFPWREEPGRLQSRGSQRIGRDLATEQKHTIIIIVETVC